MSYQGRTRKFGRKRDQRKHLMRSLSRSVILHERITTTEAKAKSVRPYVEKLVTRASSDTLANRRFLLSRFNNDTMIVSKLMRDLGPKYRDRKGGYTRIIKFERIPGSGRTTAIIEFV